jgi:molecular chaperone GrpE
VEANDKMSRKKDPLANKKEDKKDSRKAQAGEPTAPQVYGHEQAQQSEEEKREEPVEAELTRLAPKVETSEAAPGTATEEQVQPRLSPEEIAGLVKGKEEYYDRLLRTQADFDNYRKRAQKETANLLKYGAEKALREILPVVDNLDRALESARRHTESNSNVIEGIELIVTQFRSVLDKLGVSPIETVGHPFDPNRHDALLRVYAPDAPDGEVLGEVRKGYYFYDKVLRPAQVTVAIREGPLGAGPKPEEQPEGG